MYMEKDKNLNETTLIKLGTIIDRAKFTLYLIFVLKPRDLRILYK